MAAGVAVLVSGVLDGLDGAVALLTGRVTRWGGLVDSVADRLSEIAFLLTLVVLGAPARICAAGLVAAWLLEYVRARALAVGFTGIGVVTVGERPTRVAVAAGFACAAGVLPGGPAFWAGLGATVWAVTAVIGVVHLLLVLRGLPGGDPTR